MAAAHPVVLHLGICCLVHLLLVVSLMRIHHWNAQKWPFGWQLGQQTKQTLKEHADSNLVSILALKHSS